MPEKLQEQGATLELTTAHLELWKQPAIKGRRTAVYAVTTRGAIVVLGNVTWFAHWRRYVFYPGARTLYDASCLSDLAYFVRTATERRQAARKRERGAQG